MSTLSAPTRVAPGPRGFFDAVLALGLVYGVYAATPWGALVETGVRIALDQKNTPSLFSTFRGRETHVQLELGRGALTAAPADVVPPAVADAARRAAVDERVLLAYMTALGQCDATKCTAPRPPELETWLGRDVERDTVDALDIAESLARAAARFRSLDLAVEAQFLPAPILARAIAQAETGDQAALAHDVEVHAAFITPALRRGPLQDAIRVLATHRLHTLAWPVDKRAPITSPFGERVHPVLGVRKFHNGTDVGVRTGTPLKSAHRGRVHRAGRDSVSGLYVIVDHGLGIETAYCHLSEHAVRTDDVIVREQPVGLSGATGRVTGPHLHYILRIDGKEADPQLYGEAPRRAP